MTDRRRSLGGFVSIGIAVSLAVAAGAWAQEDAAAQKVAAIKQSLASSMAALKSYEWIETTTVKLKGEQKSQTGNRVYYGADGKQQKVPVEGQAADEGKKPRGLRGRAVENKKEDMGEYVQKAMALVKQYIPPDPARLQAVKDKGAQKLSVLDNAARMRVEFPGYLKAGDLLAVDIDPNANKILGISVSSYIDEDPKDVVKLDVAMGALQDGTTYPAKIQLNGQSQELDVVIENTGYRKTAS